MEKFKEITTFAIICYISCLLTKIVINRLTFDTYYLIDSLAITLGATIGWFSHDYFQYRKKKKNIS